MAEKSFSFASPGVFLNEIDQSQIAKPAAPVGPVIIGRAQRGPSMRPVTVASYDEFVATFGDPVAGADSSGDVWRSGIPAGPTYGPYAAQAWLANSATVTYIRLLGVQSETATGTTNNSGQAGWKLGGDPSPDSNDGAYGLFIFPSGSGVQTDVTLTGSLAAVWYCTGSVPVLSGSRYGSSTYICANGSMINSTAGVFTIQMSGTATAIGVDKNLKKTFDFNPTSGKFIRKVFNTNPQNCNSDSISGLTTGSTNFYGYWLGETFENDFYKNAFSGSVAMASATADSVGMILPLLGFGDRLGQEAEDLYSARTGWVISQVSQGLVPNYNAATTATKLFRLLALDGGDWIRNNLKVTINNIMPPQNEAQKYATFDVEVRRIYDTDANRKLVESFTGCTLDPSSPSYIARKIGDYSYSWDDATRRLNQVGTYPNNSKYVRVEMASEDLDASLVPFGVLGPLKVKDQAFPSGSASTSDHSWIQKASSSFGWSPNTSVTGNITYTFPSARTRVSSSEDSLTTYTMADWGSTTTRDATSLLYNDSINDLMRIPAVGASEFTSGIADTLTGYAWKFSLDEVCVTGSTVLQYVYKATSKAISGAIASNNSFTMSGSYVDLLNNGVNSFTTTFQGGTDGFNILEREPLRNTAMSANSTNDNSYIYYANRRAIDTVVDPEFVQANLLSIPGLTHEPLTQYLTQVAEKRGDALAVIDCSGDSTHASYITPYELNDDHKATTVRAVSVDNTVAEMRTRNLNTSYGATYYPWVQIADSNSGKIVTVPPSIPAIGAMSYTDKVQAPWFAPAGFNRGGLSKGTAGVNVVNAVKKLNQSDRDKLYAVNINPITSFPNEGIVIFGQKTLQATPSALDRINVRRLMIYIKRGINEISNATLFEPNVEDTWNNFKDKAEPFLADVKARFGLTEYRLILDSTTTTPDMIDQNIMYAKVLLKPARAIEFIAIDFFITRSGASFNA